MSNQTKIAYDVRLAGDETFHEHFRETVHELGGTVNREAEIDENFCDFYEPDVEEENQTVVCPECRESFPANEAAMTMDQTNWDSGDNATAVIRRYICSDDCAIALVGGDES